MKGEWRAFLSAVQFLTRLPVPDPGWEEGRLDRAAKWFPAVGGLVGGIGALALLAAVALGQPAVVPILLSLLVIVLATGALHEDGLADTADGLGGGRDTAHRLAIMKDSSIGTYGAIALIFAFALRFWLYAETPMSQGASLSGTIAAAFIGAHCVSRAGMLSIVWSLPYVRDEGSAKVAPLSAPATRAGLAIAAMTVLIACLPLAFAISVIALLTGLACAAAAMLALRALYRRKLGGWTGDAAGATQVICEIAFLIGVAAWI